MNLCQDEAEEIEEGKEAVEVDTAEIMTEAITEVEEEVEVETTTRMMIAIKIGQGRSLII